MPQIDTQKRILVIGGPKVGKTTFAGPDALHTDDLMGKLKWSEQSDVASYWFDSPGPWIIEGVTVPRALRKWLDRNLNGKPADVIVHILTPKVEINEGQRKMGLSVETIFNEIREELVNRGVEIIERK